MTTRTRAYTSNTANIAKGNMPLTEGNVRGAMKQGEAAPRPSRKAAFSVTPFVDALKDAVGFHRKAFYIEMGVCLTFLSAKGSTDKNTRAALRPIYEKAGYDCKDKNGDDYKTVQRRTDVAAKLLDWMGGEEVSIADWTEDAKPADAIKLVAERLEKDGMDSIQAIRRKVEAGKVQKEKERAAAREKARLEAVAKAQAEAAKLAGQPPAQGSASQAGEGDGGNATPPAPPASPSAGPEGSALPPMSDAERNMLEGAAARSEAPASQEPAGNVVAFNRRSDDKVPLERVLTTGHLRLVIPVDTPVQELSEMIGKISEFIASSVRVAAVAA